MDRYRFVIFSVSWRRSLWAIEVRSRVIGRSGVAVPADRDERAVNAGRRAGAAAARRTARNGSAASPGRGGAGPRGCGETVTGDIAVRPCGPTCGRRSGGSLRSATAGAAGNRGTAAGTLGLFGRIRARAGSGRALGPVPPGGDVCRAERVVVTVGPPERRDRQGPSAPRPGRGPEIRRACLL